MKRLDNLINQFIQAEAIKHPDINSKEFLQDFSNYLKQMQHHAKVYTKFLSSLGFDFKEENTVEVGKGKDDTVVIPYNTNIITTDPEYRFLDVDQKRIIAGKMIVCSKFAFLYNGQNITRLPHYMRNIMTQNPYNEKEIDGFDDLHNYNNANIIVGMYGSIHDGDIKHKVSMLKNLKHRLNANIIEDYGLNDETYFYVVGSSLKEEKVKSKIRDRVYQKTNAYSTVYTSDNVSKRSR